MKLWIQPCNNSLLRQPVWSRRFEQNTLLVFSRKQNSGEDFLLNHGPERPWYSVDIIRASLQGRDFSSLRPGGKQHNHLPLAQFRLFQGVWSEAFSLKPKGVCKTAANVSLMSFLGWCQRQRRRFFLIVWSDVLRPQLSYKA